MQKFIFALLIACAPILCHAQAKTTPHHATAAPAQGQVYQFVEQMPTFAGDVNQYLKNNLHYPAAATQASVQGRVLVHFVVKADGSIDDATIIRGIGSGCDEEALRVVRGMPHWTAGRQNGQAVAVAYTLPVVFSMQ